MATSDVRRFSRCVCFFLLREAIDFTTPFLNKTVSFLKVTSCMISCKVTNDFVPVFVLIIISI